MNNNYHHIYDGGNGGRDNSLSLSRRTISLDTVFYLLSNQRRRYVLYCLNRFPGNVIELDHLVQYVAAMERKLQSDVDADDDTGADVDAGADGDADADTVTGIGVGTTETDSSYDSAPIDQDTSTYRHKLAVDLLHTHLPKLADAGVIDYDTRSGTIRYWVHPSLLEWLEHAEYKECDRRSGS